MKEVHFTNASNPGVRCLSEMKASTNKKSLDSTYTMTAITRAEGTSTLLVSGLRMSKKSRGNKKLKLVRTTELTRHRIASALEGKIKNHPAQCIPPNTTPATDIKSTGIHGSTSLNLEA